VKALPLLLARANARADLSSRGEVVAAGAGNARALRL